MWTLSASLPPLLNLSTISEANISFSSLPQFQKYTYLFNTFPRKLSPVCRSFTFPIWRPAQLHLTLQSFIVDLPLSIGSVTLACTHAQVLPHITNKQEEPKNLALVPVSTLFLLPSLSLPSYTPKLIERECVFVLPSHSLPRCSLTFDPTSLLTLL